MNCPKCHRPSLQVSRGREDQWCRYVTDCGYSSRTPTVADKQRLGDRAIIENDSRALPLRSARIRTA